MHLKYFKEIPWGLESGSINFVDVDIVVRGVEVKRKRKNLVYYIIKESSIVSALFIPLVCGIIGKGKLRNIIVFI